MILGGNGIDLRALRERPRPLQVVYVISVVFLVAVFFFPDVKGAHRWIRLGGQRFQPSEFFKPLAVLINNDDNLFFIFIIFIIFPTSFSSTFIYIFLFLYLSDKK